MSTRAVYTFKDDDGEYHVYKHHDGYPRGAVEFIENAIPYAWQLPRWEASEFAAAFIAGNKSIKDGVLSGGGVYCTHHYNDHGDLEYRYEITFDSERKVIIVTAFDYYGNDQIFQGTIEEMHAWIKSEEPD